ncbi:MAG: hypothetical protein RJA15_507 [Actinomycetota bacterium]
MFSHRPKFLIAAVLASAIIAGCGGADDSSRSRNVALDGKQQCLSDEATTIDADGLVQLSFCNNAVSYEVFEGATVVVPKTDIEPNSIPQLQAPAGARTFRVVAYKTDGTQAGEDVVTTKTEACSTGGTCVVGDTGPGGGIVVYDAGSQQDWGQYIEMARKGWYDNTEGSNASPDPLGSFACDAAPIQIVRGWAQTPVGTAKTFTDRLVENCGTSSPTNPKAYAMVRDYRSAADPLLDDWAIPSSGDGAVIQQSTSFDALLLSTEKDDSESTSRVRPIRYFTSTGPVTPTVKVVGIMYPAPTDVTIDPVTQDSTSATSPVVDSTPISNETPATSGTGCSVAPTVTYPEGIITSDDTVTFTITHPCMGLNQQKGLNIGRAEFDENNEPVFDTYQSINVTSDVLQRKARLAAGDHTFLFLLEFKPSGGYEMYQSQAARIDISVSEGPSKTSPICSPDKITVIGTTLSVACPYIQGLFTISLPYNGQQEMMTFLELSGDKETYTADLSTMNSGWRRAHLTVNYGLESLNSQMAVCVRECAMSTSAEPFEMTIKDDVASISFSSGCSGSSFVNQAFKASDNLYFITNDWSIFFDDKTVIDVPLRQSTAALVFGRWCEGDGLPFTSTFVSLARNASAPSAEDLLPVVNTTVATVALTELTGGMTDLPVGKTEGGSVSVSPQTESVAITPDVVKELFNVTIAGSKVETVEMSTNGKSWVPASFGALALPAEVKSMSVRLTAENGTQTVITRDVERVEKAVVVGESADSGSQSILSYWWILLLLFVLLAGAMAVKKKRTA